MPYMEASLKHFLERTTPFGALARRHRQKKLEKKFQKWETAGGKGPMPDLGKQQVVLEYIKTYAPDVFIETGTYKRDQDQKCGNQFDMQAAHQAAAASASLNLYPTPQTVST